MIEYNLPVHMPDLVLNDTLSQAHIDVETGSSEDSSGTMNITPFTSIELEHPAEENHSNVNVPNKRKSSSCELEISQLSKRRRMSVAERDIELSFIET
jgi:hypothetical protein